MTKEERINAYIKRIKLEISYKNYAEAKALCIRVMNLDYKRLDVIYVRNYLEKLQRENGRYEALRSYEYISFLEMERKEITPENIDKLDLYFEILEEEMPSINSYLDSSYLEKLENIVGYFESIMAEDELGEIFFLVESLKNYKEKTELAIEMQEKREEERKVAEENRKGGIAVLIAVIIILGFVLIVAANNGAF